MYCDALLTKHFTAASANSYQRVGFARGNAGVSQRSRVESESLQRRSRCSPADPCHDTSTRRRHSDEAHAAAQLCIFQRQQRTTTTTRQPSQTT